MIKLNNENSGEKTTLYPIAKKIDFHTVKDLIEMDAHLNLENFDLNILFVRIVW